MYDKNGINLDFLLGSEWNPSCSRGITMQEFATKNNISYEAVRRQVSQHREKLYPHMRKENRTQYFDDIAVAFLEEHRRPQTQPEDIQKIQRQMAQFQEHVEKSLDFSKKMLELSQENGSLMEKLAALQENLEDLTQENQSLKAQLAESQALLEHLKSEHNTQSQEQRNKINDLTFRITYMEMYSQKLENLVKILSSPHARNPQDDFDL